MQKWEYHTQDSFSRKAAQETLNKMGEEGWELVSATVQTDVQDNRAPRTSHTWTLFLKRPKD